MEIPALMARDRGLGVSLQTTDLAAPPALAGIWTMPSSKQRESAEHA
jgi:hypothetical protein